MSAGGEYVERLALAWAATDPIESWVIGNDGALSAAELRDVIDDYLGRKNPFPDGMSVETRGLDTDQHLEQAIIVARVDRNEWTVEFEDGAEAWRGYAELRPLAEARD